MDKRIPGSYAYNDRKMLLNDQPDIFRAGMRRSKMVKRKNVMSINYKIVIKQVNLSLSFKDYIFAGMRCKRKRYMKIVVMAVLPLLVLSSAAAAQTEKDARMSIRGSCTVPHPLKNKAFKKSLTGIYNANLSLSLRTFSSFNIGFVYNNALYKTAANKIPQVNTAMQVNGAGIRLSYDRFLSDKVFFAPAIVAGRQEGVFTGVICPIPISERPRYSANYIEPELNLYFIVDPNFAIGINTSCMLNGHTFDPYAVCFNEYRGYEAGDLKGNMVSLSFGFGFYFGFWGGAPRNE